MCTTKPPYKSSARNTATLATLLPTSVVETFHNYSSAQQCHAPAERLYEKKKQHAAISGLQMMRAFSLEDPKMMRFLCHRVGQIRQTTECLLRVCIFYEKALSYQGRRKSRNAVCELTWKSK